MAVVEPERAAAGARSVAELDDVVTGCRACPRLVAWREETARVRRPAYRKWEYWGRPVPGFGSGDAAVLVVGLAPRRRTAATGRGECSPGTGPATCCSGRCTTSVWPTVRHRRGGATG